MTAADVGWKNPQDEKGGSRNRAARSKVTVLRPRVSLTAEGDLRIDLQIVGRGPASVDMSFTVRTRDGLDLVVDKPTVTVGGNVGPVDVTLNVQAPPDGSLLDSKLELTARNSQGNVISTNKITIDADGNCTAKTTLSATKKLAIAGTAIAVAAGAITLAVVILPDPDPIALVGNWKVTPFAFSAEGGGTTSASLAGGDMTIEPEEGCTGDDCPLVIATGPELLQGVRLEPRDGRSEYVGENVRLTKSCDGTEIPSNLLQTRFIAKAGNSHDNDKLSFVIENRLVEEWNSCSAGGSTYEATAERNP